jgi:TnpA family transposase
LTCGNKSIEQGTVSASLMLRKLGAYPRQNGLAMALRELGRIERTLFTLEWLQAQSSVGASGK